jgi:hypothetical protein
MRTKIILAAGMVLLPFCFPHLVATQPREISPGVVHPVPPARGIFHTEFGHILGLETTDTGDTLLVKLDVPFVNSDDFQDGEVRPCEARLKVYASNLTEPQAKFNEAILLSAFVSGKEVRMILEGCLGTNPRIAGVGIGVKLY